MLRNVCYNVVTLNVTTLGIEMDTSKHKIDMIMEDLITDWQWAMDEDNYEIWSLIYHRLCGMTYLCHVMKINEIHEEIYFLSDVARLHRGRHFDRIKNEVIK